MKPVIAYINPDCFADTDLSVLKYLSERYVVEWYPVYYTDRQINYAPEELSAYALEHGLNLHLCPRLYRQRDPRNLGFYAGIVKDINSRGASLVYTCITEELWWTAASVKLTVPVKVLGVHDVVKHSYSNRIKRGIQALFQKWAIDNNPNVCVFSENQRRLFRTEYGREAHNLGMSCKDFGPPAGSPSEISRGVSLLFFGNIVKYKGLDLLISALEGLRARGIENITLTIAGRGEDLDYCRSLMRTKEIYRLIPRFIENSEVPGLMCSHHFLVLPYRDSTQSGPLLIAANYGVPVLAPRNGCFTEVYDDDSAVLYDTLEDGLQRVSALSDDSYEAIRSKASAIRERFSEEAIAEKYCAYFDSLCGRE